MKLSVVVPAYNEEKRIVSTVERISEYLIFHDYSFEMIVVDDGSTDDTCKIIKDKFGGRIKLIKNGRNRGKGYSVKAGFMQAAGDLVLLSDSDLSTPISELEKLIPYIGPCPIVVGSRNMSGSDVKVQQSKVRILLGKAFPKIVRALLGLRIKDTQCGFKLFDRERCKPVFERQRIDGFAFDAEILFISASLGLKVYEGPISWRNDSDSRLNVAKHMPQMLRDVIRIKINSLRGIYR